MALHQQKQFPAKRVLIAIDVTRNNRDKGISGGMVGMTAESGISLMVSILMNACPSVEGVVVNGVPATATRAYDIVACSHKEVDAPEGEEAAPEGGQNAGKVQVPDFPAIAMEPRASPADIVKKMEQIHSYPVDVAALLNHCTANKLNYDAFIVLAGSIHTPNPPYAVSNALRIYREELKIPKAKMVVVGISSKMFNIAHPDDPYSLDVLGLSSSVVHQIRDFLEKDLLEPCPYPSD